MYKIIEKKRLSDFVISVKICAPLVAKHAKAGQFVIVRPNLDSERIPLTIADYDRDGQTVTIAFQPVGETTAELAALNEGDYISDVCGPLGRPTETSGIKNAVVVGGGVGSAIALPVAKAFKAAGAKVTAIIGFKNQNAVILLDEFKAACDKVILVTDDGSAGEKGFVTSPLERILAENADCNCDGIESGGGCEGYKLCGEKIDEVMAVGPVIMMKNVSKVTEKYGVKTIVSMNPIMIDGTGMCGGCRLNVDGKIKFACVDGPDFDGHKVDYDSLLKRNSQYAEFESHRRENCNLFKKA
ncbi:MAG: sulfide/dihydroorotate dehydrogenase-like FAD/NAD-binding protein [Candidatus Borkfalkiaceae bacterium]|nr:sulfide/dihydroorotate dehydrogenase-like FAD/NAD-binding protein [Christensenellaceae bacterium]